jgi:hypothetical protein
MSTLAAMAVLSITGISGAHAIGNTGDPFNCQNPQGFNNNADCISACNQYCSGAALSACHLSCDNQFPPK